MKTLKNTTIIAGIIVALFSLTAHATDKPKGDLTKAEKNRIMFSMGLDKAFEITLIEEYLEEQEIMEVEIPTEKKIMIYNADDELIYEGAEYTEEAILLQQRADFLMEHEQVTYFRLH